MLESTFEPATAGPVLRDAVATALRELEVAAVATRQVGRVAEPDLSESLTGAGTVIARAEANLVGLLRESLIRGLDRGAGFGPVDWVKQAAPGISRVTARDVAVVAKAGLDQASGLTPAGSGGSDGATGSDDGSDASDDGGNGDASVPGVFGVLLALVAQGELAVYRAARVVRVVNRVRTALTAGQAKDLVAALCALASEAECGDQGLQEACDRVIQRLLPDKDPEGREKSKHQMRHVHTSSLSDGSVQRVVITCGSAADYAAIQAILASPLAAPATSRDTGTAGVRDERTAGQRRYDALLSVLRRGVAGGAGQPVTPKAQVVVTITLATLIGALVTTPGCRTSPTSSAGPGTGPGPGTGFGAGGSSAGFDQPGDPSDWLAGLTGLAGMGSGAGETLDGTRISAERVRQLACEADIIPIILGTKGQILDQGRRYRTVTAAQRLYLAQRDRGCSYPGCTVPATWCDSHHIVHWAHGGRSDVNNYALLCPRHHTRVHHDGLTATLTALGITWHT